MEDVRTDNIVAALTVRKRRCYHRTCSGTALASPGPRRLAWPRTSPFHGGNTGSNPVGDANLDKEVLQCCFRISKRLKPFFQVLRQPYVLRV